MGRVILVVEDDEFVRDFTLEVLRREGHDVMTAESVDVARRTIFARPDADQLCLVIDVVLAHESGIEFARELLERYTGFHVLLISGFTDAVLMTETEHTNRMAFLAKPFDRRQLLSAIDELCC